MKNTQHLSHKDYDQEPVKYCPRCYSLKIGNIDGVEDSDYCMKCGCSEIAETSIEEWEKKYKDRYGHAFVVRNDNPERARLSNLTTNEIKQEFYDNQKNMEIIRSMYPDFPRYLGVIDSVLLFFDKVCKDGRMEELKDRMSASPQPSPKERE